MYNLKEPICNLVDGEDVKLWENDWLNNDANTIFNDNSIINKDILNNLPFIIKWNEVSLFGY